MGLTSSQATAITHAGGNLQLIAGAASGKTEVARRVVHREMCAAARVVVGNR